MAPQLSAYMGMVYLTVGMIGVLIMLEIQGNPKKRVHLRTWILTHRTLGYLFILIYIVMSGFMIAKTGAYRQELSPRAVIHIALGLLLAPALGFKLLIVRRDKRFLAYLPVLGTLIFAVASVQIGLTSGYYFLHKSTLTTVSLLEMDDTVLNERIAWRLLDQKCSKCHSLERVLKAKKSKEAWAKTIVRMAHRDAPHIRPSQARQILLYLSAMHPADRSAVDSVPKAMTAEALVETKCSKCHDLSRIYQAKKDLATWHKTVKKMIENAEEIGEFDFLTETEVETIVQFLAHGK